MKVETIVYKTILIILMMMVVSLTLNPTTGICAVLDTENAAIISDGNGIRADNTTSELIDVKDTLTRADVSNNGVMLSEAPLADKYNKECMDNTDTMIKTDSTLMSYRSLGNIDGVVNLNQVDKNEVQLSDVELRLCDGQAYKGEVFTNSLGTGCSDNFSNPVAYIEDKSDTEITPLTGIQRNERDEIGNVATAAINEVAITDKTLIDAICWVTPRYLTSDFTVIYSSETTTNDRTTNDVNPNDYIQFTDQIISNGPTSDGRGVAATVANTNTIRLLG